MTRMVSVGLEGCDNMRACGRPQEDHCARAAGCGDGVPDHAVAKRGMLSRPSLLHAKGIVDTWPQAWVLAQMKASFFEDRGDTIDDGHRSDIRSGQWFRQQQVWVAHTALIATFNVCVPHMTDIMD